MGDTSLTYGSIFGKNTGIITGILYVISIGIGILIPVIQGKVDRRKTFWVVIEKIAITATTIMVSVLSVLGRIFRGPMGEDSCRKQCQTLPQESLCGGSYSFQQ